MKYSRLPGFPTEPCSISWPDVSRASVDHDESAGVIAFAVFCLLSAPFVRGRATLM